MERSDSKVEEEKLESLDLSINDLWDAQKAMEFPIRKYRRDRGSIVAMLLLARNAAVQVANSYSNIITDSEILKAVNLRYPGLINVMLVPTRLMKEEMTEKLAKNTFIVGDLMKLKDDLDDIRFPDVYVGVYDELEDSQLINLENRFGFLMLEECHTLFNKPFEKSLQIIDNYKLNSFPKIYVSSCTLNFEMAKRIYQLLGIKGTVNYSDFAYDYPHQGRVYINALDYGNNRKETCLKLVREFLWKYPYKKAVIYFKDEKILDDIKGDLTGLVVTLGMSKDEKFSVISKFHNDPSEHLLMGTDIELTGLYTDQLSLAIFYDYIPEPIDLIQAVRPLKQDGICLLLTKDQYCASEVYREFYNIDSQLSGCVFCCGNIPSRPLSIIYATLMKVIEPPKVYRRPVSYLKRICPFDTVPPPKRNEHTDSTRFSSTSLPAIPDSNLNPETQPNTNNDNPKWSFEPTFEDPSPIDTNDW